MVKKIFLGIVLLLFFLVPFVSAIDTEITIKTLPYHEVQVTVFNPFIVAFQVYESFKNTSNAYGDVSFVFSSTVDKFGLVIYVKKNNEKVVSQKYSETFNSGDPLYLEIAPSGVELRESPVIEEELNQTSETNTTINNSETEQNISANEINPNIAGSVVSDEEGFFLSKRVVYYSSGGLVLFLMIGFVLFIFTKRIRKRIISSEDIKVKKLSEMKKEKEDLERETKERIDDHKDTIEDAEKKIKEAQEEIKRLKDEDRIKEVKQKIIEDQKELMRLREGKN